MAGCSFTDRAAVVCTALLQFLCQTIYLNPHRRRDLRGVSHEILSKRVCCAALLDPRLLDSGLSRGKQRFGLHFHCGTELLVKAVSLEMNSM